MLKKHDRKKNRVINTGEKVIAVVRQSERDYREGKFFTGDLRKVLKSGDHGIYE